MTATGKGYVMDKLSGSELKRARLVPSSMFANPEAVVRSGALSRAQKIEILRRWELDARRADASRARVVAVFAMAAGLPLLDQVQGALATLGALAPARQAPPPTRH